MSRDRLLPSVLSRIHPNRVIPQYAIGVTVLMMAVSVALLDVERIAKLASAFLILMFVLANVCVIVLRETGSKWYAPTFRSPLYPGMQIFGVLSGLAVILAMGWLAVASVVAMMAFGAAFFFVYGRKRAPERLGALQRFGKRDDILKTGKHRAPSNVFPPESTSDTEVVVSLFDPSPPEPLVELSAALAEGKPVGVFYVKEVPEQVDPDALYEPSPMDRAIERRTRHMASQVGAEVSFETVFCRDVRSQVYEFVDDIQPKWLLFEWQSQGHDAVWVRNPLAWLFSHLPCNVAVFKDAGVRVFEKILVVADATRHDRLLARTADLLADMVNGEVTFAGFAPEEASNEERNTVEQYQAALVKMVRSPARSLVISGKERLEAMVVLTASHDLLLLEEPLFQPFYSHFTRDFEDRLVDLATCSVLRLRIPHEPEFGEDIERPPLPSGTEMLASCFDEALIQTGLQVERKRDVFATIASLYQSIHGGSRRDVETALWYRERQQPSNIGGGLALAHATIDGLESPHLGLMLLEEPVNWHVQDSPMVDIVLFCVGPSPDHHTFEVLRPTVEQMAQSGEFVEALRATVAGTPAEVREVLMRFVRAQPE
jgi:mannitol/fructose-specific phosphotransferase system IIA component (Ntr-type)